jgi:hypothetical protein
MIAQPFSFRLCDRQLSALHNRRDIIKRVEETYEWPRLRMALANEFMIYLDEHEASTLPSKQQAWPDWWTDGFGSAMNETKAARTAHADMIANTGLLSLARLMGAQLPVDIQDEISVVFVSYCL